MKNNKDPRGILRTQGAFSDKVTLDIDDFTNEPVVQCNVQIVQKNFVVNSK